MNTIKQKQVIEIKPLETGRLKNATKLYKSYESALTYSAVVTANPSAVSVIDPRNGKMLYAACGEHYIKPTGSRGQWYYGINGVMLEFIDVELE